MNWDAFKATLKRCSDEIENDIHTLDDDGQIIGRTVQGVILAIYEAVDAGTKGPRDAAH